MTPVRLEPAAPRSRVMSCTPDRDFRCFTMCDKSYSHTSHSTKVMGFQLIIFAKNITTNLDFLNFNFNTEQLSAINHSSR